MRCGRRRCDLKVEEIENEWREAWKPSRKEKKRGILKGYTEANIWGGKETGEGGMKSRWKGEIIGERNHEKLEGGWDNRSICMGEMGRVAWGKGRW